MKKSYKKIGIIAIILIVVIVIVTFVANFVVERKIKNALAELKESVSVEFSSIDADIWSGSLVLSSPRLTVNGETTDKTILEANLNNIEIDDLSYWDYFFNDKISVETIDINEPIVKYKHNPLVQKDDYKSGFLDKIKQVIAINNISITEADVLITNYATDSTLLSVPKFNFELYNLQINSKASKTNKKFEYKNFTLNAKNLKWATNSYDDLFADSIHFTNNEGAIKGLKLKTKYTRAKFSKILKKERDHFDLTIKEVTLNDLDFGLNDSEKFFFNSNIVTLNVPEAEIYRDKLVVDDKTSKLLYGAMLREMNMDLTLRTIEIIDGKISYLEKVKKEEHAGRLDFTNMNATITNLGNTFGNEDTMIKVNSTFMENSPLKVDWYFKVADVSDHFVFKADLGFLKAEQMDQFTQPNLHVDLNGELKQTYFTINGNPETSRIDLKVKYDDFEVSVLKKDGKEKNKFLSTIVNLFVSKDSEDDKKAYRYGQSEQVKRDVTKSVFNFVWLNIKAGLRSAMAGDGKKKNK